MERGISLLFWIPSVTKREKNEFSEKKSRVFDKLIMKNVQNELLYKNSRIFLTNTPVSTIKQFIILLQNLEHANCNCIFKLIDWIWRGLLDVYYYYYLIYQWQICFNFAIENHLVQKLHTKQTLQLTVGCKKK